MKVLMIDDDPALVTVITTAMQVEGFQAVTANNGRSGIEQAKIEKPDFILLDQVLPDIQGNEVLTTLKSDPQTKSIPVAIISNFNKPELMQEAIKLGAVDYILKYQIEPKDLLNKISSLTQSTPQITQS
ncbi:MAG TPA: response regulator [Patescibacteria group bacterium]|nr:response regulator [Patescibacteria group bacterium]